MNFVINDELKQVEKWIVRDLFDLFEKVEFRDKSNLSIITKNAKYSITAFLKDEDGKDDYSYLGCIATNRYPDEGETWLRGSDLHDGRFGEDGWNAIVDDIKEYEEYKN